VLAAIAGATGLASVSNRITAAYLALAAAGLGALVTALNTDRRTTQAHSAANAYLEVQTAARQLREVDLENIEYEEARTKLHELTARRDEINKQADIPAFYAYWKGKRNIKKNRQKYGQDKARKNGK
jgi:Mrp family chromosome partitioning ATPase